jgi:hypothetical protein
MEKIKVFDVKWTFKDKYLQQLHHLEILKIIYIYRKFQCTSLIKSSFNNGLFYFIHSDTIFESTFFIFSL